MLLTTIHFEQSAGHLDNASKILRFEVPLLPAYAIEHAVLAVNGLGGYTNFELTGTNLLFDLNQYTLQPGELLILTIYYHGIRDYEMLFPKITDPHLRTRLGNYYSESEKTFESGSWLSFSLMCGAIFEGLLYHLIGKNVSFHDLIEKAKLGGHIDAVDAYIMHMVRDARNLIHANKAATPYVTRTQGMDIRTTLDKMIRKMAE